MKFLSWFFPKKKKTGMFVIMGWIELLLAWNCDQNVHFNKNFLHIWIIAQIDFQWSFLNSKFTLYHSVWNLKEFVSWIFLLKISKQEIWYLIMRWVQVTPFFKPLDLSKSNKQKKTIINTNILIKISLIIPYLLYFISISKPRNIWLSFSTFLSLPLSPSPLFHLHG